MNGHRRHASWLAFLVHRLSGLALGLFLPVHFWALGQAITGEASFEGFLRWAEQPLVKLSETLLVTLLALHMAGGLRLLVLEFLPWHRWQKGAVAAAAGFGAAIGLLYLLDIAA